MALPSAPSPPAIAAQPAPRGGNPIKGNISSKGRRLYHAPGCPQYERVQIDERAGERRFATEAEALAAGWRKSPDCP